MPKPNQGIDGCFVITSAVMARKAMAVDDDNYKKSSPQIFIAHNSSETCVSKGIIKGQSTKGKATPPPHLDKASQLPLAYL
ncbi:MAG: hypothetical protein V1823_03355 [Chloroflexota bacterium]